MNAGFGAWLFGMSLGAGALGGMLGIAAACSSCWPRRRLSRAALCSKRFRLCRRRGTAFLLFLDPGMAIQLVIIISTPYRSPWFGVAAGNLAVAAAASGGRQSCRAAARLVAFRHADPILVRAAAGATIFGFAC